MSMVVTPTPENEVSILPRVLDNNNGPIPQEFARYLLELEFSERDQARMHELASRNQNDALSPTEKEELHAFAKVGTMLSILQSKARRSLNIKPQTRPVSWGVYKSVSHSTRLAEG